MTTVVYRGVNRGGTHVVGSVDRTEVALFVEAKFRCRWRELDIVGNGETIGHIGRHPDTNQRVWWAEK